MSALRKGVGSVDVGGHELCDRVVPICDIGTKFVEGSMQIVDRSVVGKQEPEEGFNLDVWRLGSGCCPLFECTPALAGDLVDVAGSIADSFLVGGGMAEFNELLRLRIEEALRFGPGVSEAALCLVSEFVGGPWLQVEQGENRCTTRLSSWVAYP